MLLSMNNLTKSYQVKSKFALAHFSAQLSPGIYGIIGANGAGKSTLMNIITDNLKPDHGEVTFNGVPITKLGSKYREIIGYMPQQQGLYDEMTGYRFLWFMASLKGLSKREAKEKITNLLKIVNLEQDAHKKLSAYSGGMKQRILIAQALLNDPHILILDEPTAGLDPKERVNIRNFIATIALNKIVLFATHVVTDIESIAKEVILMQKGRKIAQASPALLSEQVKGFVFEVIIDKEHLPIIQQQYKVSNITTENEQLSVRIISLTEPELEKARRVKPSLEDVYLYYLEHANYEK